MVPGQRFQKLNSFPATGPTRLCALRESRAGPRSNSLAPMRTSTLRSDGSETALLLPGTARAALGRDLVQAVDLLEGQASVSTSPMVAVAGSVFEETHNADDVTDRVILNRYDELQAALAGGYDIAVDEEDGIKYFHVSDDTGRQPLPTVAARVEADAETARTRLAASERDVIIRFLLGELGDELRERLLEAEDLVAAANTALADVRTSHGKGARLEWKVDPDEADEVRTADNCYC